MLLTVFLTICAFSCISSIHGDETKRLLVDDQQSIQTVLNGYESRLQVYQSEVQQLQQEIATLKANQQAVQQQLNNQNAGTTYVRWGRTTCPTNNNTEIVYDGVAGGSMFSDQGAAVDYLCLPHNPDHNINAIDIIPHHGYSTGLLYGSEYQFSYGNVKIEDDVPCVVCHVRQASSTLMIPAKATCPQKWTKQYSGLLSSNEHTFIAGSQYVCLDGNPEYLEGTRNRNENGKLFYPVKAACGSLPCPPYHDNDYVGCVVCTK